MTWVEYFNEVLILIAVWLVWLWLTQPKYEDGRYVSIRDRLRKVSQRLLRQSNKQRADDP